MLEQSPDSDIFWISGGVTMRDRLNKVKVYTYNPEGDDPRGQLVWEIVAEKSVPATTSVKIGDVPEHFKQNVPNDGSKFIPVKGNTYCIDFSIDTNAFVSSNKIWKAK